MPRFPQDEFQQRIDEILYYVWDPIGVKQSPRARWEYRTYAKTIHKMIQGGKNLQGIVDYLIELESGFLAGVVNRNRSQKVAELIFDHKAAIEEGVA